MRRKLPVSYSHPWPDHDLLDTLLAPRYLLGSMRAAGQSDDRSCVGAAVASPCQLLPRQEVFFSWKPLENMDG